MSVRIALALIIIALVLGVPALYQIYREKKRSGNIRLSHYVWLALSLLVPVAIGLAIYYT